MEVKDTQLAQLLEFPCEYPVKVVGLNRDGFKSEVLHVLFEIMGIDYKLDEKPSSQGKYMAYATTITAENIEQIEKLYHNLGAIDGVKMVL